MKLREKITVPTPIEEAFAYTADFDHIDQWDPGVAESTRLDEGPIGEGSRFELLLAFGSRRIPMTYAITEYEPPSRFVLVGEGSALTAIDTITFEARETGTDITYEADLRFKGLMALLMPFLGGVTRGVGRKAVEGLQKALTP